MTHTVETFEIAKSDEEWRRQLTPEQYEVLRGHETERPAETLIAVNADSGDPSADEIVRLFEECNARQVERTEGRWENGEWADFDPASPPHLIGGRDARESANRAPPPR